MSSARAGDAPVPIADDHIQIIPIVPFARDELNVLAMELHDAVGRMWMSQNQRAARVRQAYGHQARPVLVELDNYYQAILQRVMDAQALRYPKLRPDLSAEEQAERAAVANIYRGVLATVDNFVNNMAQDDPIHE
jgi:hypothetical protein